MLTLKFDFERETKGTKRFQEVLAKGVDRGVVGTLYVTKPALEKLGNPEHLTVTIDK